MLTSAPPAAAQAAPAATSGQQLIVLDVPYIAQEPALCGGAAAAMVLRYWGSRGVQDSDFAHLVDTETEGIRTTDLVQDLRRRGLRAVETGAGDLEALAADVSRGRPPIALLRIAPGLYHYVVVVAVSEGIVLFHDPADAPYRVLPSAEFLSRWSGAGRWSVVVLPGESDEAPSPVVGVASADRETIAAPCAGPFRAGVKLAGAGRLEDARERLQAAARACPDASAPVRELAGLRFLQQDWAGASRLAETATDLDPGDAHAWRILATSRYLADEPEEALRAWNAVGEPRIDLVRVAGRPGADQRVVAERIGLEPDSLLTPGALVRARRRLQALPVARRASLRYTPVEDGLAELSAGVIPHPGFEIGIPLLARVGLDALVERRLRLQVPGPGGSGELLEGVWRWQGNRPRVALALESPDPAGVPGILRVEAEWEVETHAVAVARLRETRRRGAIGLSRWVAADTRVRGGIAVERWSGRPLDLVLSAGLERRLAGDHGALLADAGLALAPGGGAGYGTWSLRTRWRSTVDGHAVGLFLDAGLYGAGGGAPRGRWPGAGTGQGRDPLLRAHPLLIDGVVSGEAFGRRLLHGSAEGRTYPLRIGPVPVGLALFVDAVRAWEPTDERPGRLLIDAGAGLRLGVPGGAGDLRVDAATGLRGGGFTISAGWQESWR